MTYTLATPFRLQGPYASIDDARDAARTGLATAASKRGRSVVVTPAEDGGEVWKVVKSTGTTVTGCRIVPDEVTA